MVPSGPASGLTHPTPGRFEIAAALVRAREIHLYFSVFSSNLRLRTTAILVAYCI
jgi:hypothetical protein